MTTDDALQRFLADAPDKATGYVVFDRRGEASTGQLDAGSLAVLPGSFNPLHEGHVQLAALAAERLQREVLYELSVTNVDKPPLAEAEVRRRIVQFEGRARIVLTRATRFFEKAHLFPGCVFVIGWDTFARLVDARYYAGDLDAMHTAVESMRDLGCRFLVAGRVYAGAFRALEPGDVPAEFAGMFEPISESRFRVDVSSTALRGE